MLGISLVRKSSTHLGKGITKMTVSEMKSYLYIAQKHGFHYQKSGEASESPVWYGKAMLAAQRQAQNNNEKFSREAAGSAWFQGRLMSEEDFND